MFYKCLFLTLFCYFKILHSFQPSDVVFKLVTKHSKNCENPYTITESTHYNFNSKKTAVLIHGYKASSSEVQSYKKLCDCISKDADDVKNIILVDWTSIAGEYPNASSIAIQNIEYTAYQLTNLLNKLVINNGLDLSNVDLIGHSLGVYVAGLTGRYLIGTDPTPLSIHNSQLAWNSIWAATQVKIPEFCGFPEHEKAFPTLMKYIDCSKYQSSPLIKIEDSFTPLCSKPVGNIIGLDPAGPHLLGDKNSDHVQITGETFLIRSSAFKSRTPNIKKSTVFAKIALSFILENLPSSLENSRFTLIGDEAQHITQYVSDPKLLGVAVNSLDKSREYGANVVVVDGDHGSLQEPHSKIVDWYCQSIKKCQFISQNSNENLGYNYKGQNIIT